MNNARRRTFWATIDRISNQGNGVVEKEGGGHFIVGPVTEDVVGKTVEVRLIGPNEAELVDPRLRKDVFATRGGSSDSDLSEGDIVSGRLTKRSSDGIPILERDGVRIRVSGAELNEFVKVKLGTIHEDHSRWKSAAGHRIDGPDDLPIGPFRGPVGSITTDLFLYEDSPTGLHVQHGPDGEGVDTKTRVLHVTDSHLGSSLTTTPEYSEDCLCLWSFQQAINTAIQHNVDGVLNTGDLFHNDTTHGIPASVEDAARANLELLAAHNIPFYSIEGDHEGEAGRAVIDSFQSDGLVTPLDGYPTPVGDGIALCGRDYADTTTWADNEWQMQAPPSDRYTIAAFQQSINPISNNRYPDCTVEDIVSAVDPYAHVIAAGLMHTEKIEWERNLPFVVGGTTEPERARRASNKPFVGLFIQEGPKLRNQRIQLAS